MPELTHDLEELQERLDEALECRLPQIRAYERYISGEHRLAFATSRFKAAFGDLFAPFSDNWCRLVVDSSVERLTVEGFRLDNAQADKDAWSIWQANGLDAASVIAHTEAVKTGVAYILVDPFAGDIPLITIEHASQVIVERNPADRREVTAGYKRWYSQADGRFYSNLYLPDRVVKLRSEMTTNAVVGLDKTGFATMGNVKWEQYDEIGNPLGVVPIVPLENNPSLLGGGQSDLDDMIPLNDAVNKFVTDMLVASEFQAFKQRVLTGIEVPRDPDTGQPVPEAVLRSAMESVWVFEGDNAKVTELGQVDLSTYTSAIELLVQHIAAVTRTPSYYLAGQMVNLSADALKAAEIGLVSKVRRKQLDFGDAWERVIKLCFLARGDKTRAVAPVETIWKDAEAHSVSQLADSLIKLKDLGIPYEVLWAKWGASPQEIERWREMKQLPMPGSPRDLAEMVQKVYLGVGKVITADEARAILDGAGADLGSAPPSLPPA